MSNKGRNLKITERILDGRTARVVGMEFGVSGERVRQIASAGCKSLAPKLYKTIHKGRGYKAASFKLLRKYKEGFLCNLR